METWNAITSRRNVRQFDTARRLSEEDMQRILEAGRRAPSSRNWQPWDFVLVTDRELLRELSTVWQGGGHIADSAATVAFVVDTEFVEERQRLIAYYDLGQATAQMMIAAADLGIGSGHSAVGDQAKAQQLLALPQGKSVAYFMDLGYPADRPLAPLKKPNRRPFEEVVHRERW